MVAKASAVTERIALSYHKDECEPVELMDFIRLDGFTRTWKRLHLDDHDLKALRILIATAPGLPPVIVGTGGLRKIRFSPPKSHRGKSHGVRVCYAYFASFSIVLLVSVYPKNRKDNLSAAERNTIRKELRIFERRLRQGPLH